MSHTIMTEWLLSLIHISPPDGVTLDEEKYPDNKGNYFAVAKLVVDWDAGTAVSYTHLDVYKRQR